MKSMTALILFQDSDREQDFWSGSGRWDHGVHCQPARKTRTYHKMKMWAISVQFISVYLSLTYEEDVCTTAKNAKTVRDIERETRKDFNSDK